jgi:hypothetical protein
LVGRQECLLYKGRGLTPSSDPRPQAHVQVLRCVWAGDPQAAYRAFAAGVPLAERAKHRSEGAASHLPRRRSSR